MIRLLNLNLQQFAEEEEDVILPEDFSGTEEAAEPQADTEQPSEEESTIPVEETPTETTQESPKLKIKYNHEEKEIDLEEARILAQKGMNYDKLQEKLQQLENDPARKLVEKQAAQYGMTPQEYISAVEKQQEEQKLAKLTEQGIPEEYAREILESKKFRQEYQSQKQQQEAQVKQQQEMNEFIQAFPNVKPDDIKPETWAKVNQGTPLKYAYMEQERADLLQKLQTKEQNQNNKKKAPISGVTEHGANDTVQGDPFMEGFDSE